MGNDLIGYVIAFVAGAIVPVILNWLERRDSYKFIAVEKRLEAHQKAYYQCMQFFKAMDIKDENEIKKIFKNGQEFFASYSLYLNDNIRKKYIEALGFVNAYCPKHSYLNKFLPEERKQALLNYHAQSKKVFELAEIIQKEVKLIPLNFKFGNP